MSEWLPFVGLVEQVIFNESVVGLGNTMWYPVPDGWEQGSFIQRLSDTELISHLMLVYNATNVSASVSKVDDYSYRFTVRFRVADINQSGASIFRSYAVVLAKRRTEPNFRTDYDDIKKNNNYLEADFYLFGYPRLYDKFIVKQVDGIIPNLLDFEYSGVQVMQECVLRGDKIKLSSILWR